MYICNIQAHSGNYHYLGKATSVTYSKCVSAALVIQHTIRAHHIVICGLSGSTTFFYIISRHNIWKKKLLNIKCVLIISTTLV